jgi:hypothetical protein
MRIQNYDVSRAENARKVNNQKVSKYNKIVRACFFIKSSMLILMSLCVLAMAIVVIAMLILYHGAATNPIIWCMAAFTGCSLLMTLCFLMTRNKAEYLEPTYYDNMETKYHRINSDYKIVHMSVDNSNNISCLCEKDRCVEAFSLKPRLVKTTKNIKSPVLDVQHDCLWLPA